MTETELAAARRTLHAVAELLLAGPQSRVSGSIRLEVRPGGFGTVKPPELAVDGTELVAGERRIPLSGTTIEELARAVGVDAGAPVGRYDGGSEARPGDPVELDPTAAGLLLECFAVGDAALRRLAPTESPVLWPEHFDVGISVGEVNYGVSAGDSFLDEPYAYVGPWSRRAGAFWNAPFGAAVRLGPHPDVEAVLAFFSEGAQLAATDPAAHG